MASKNKLQHTLSKMAYDKPKVEKKALHLRKAWNEVSRLLNSDKKK